MVVKKGNKDHQDKADSKSQKLLLIEFRSCIFDGDQAAVVERTDQYYQKIIKFSKRECL
jgi:hypothetical protein